MQPDEQPGQPDLLQRFFFAPDGRVRAIWRALLFILLAVGLVFLLRMGVAPWARQLSPAGGVAIDFLLLNAAFLSASWVCLRAFDRRSFRTLGLSFDSGWGKELTIGCAVGVGLQVAVTATLVTTGAVVYRGPGPAQLAEVLLWGGILFIAAAFEEILFRGYAFQRLAESITPGGAVLVFSVLFGAGHLSNPNANPLSTANTVIAGVLLAVAYLKTRALWLPIGLHWASNFTMGPILSLPVSGVHPWPTLFEVQIRPPDWVSGGSYGPEGSVLLTVIGTVATVWLARSKSIGVSQAVQDVLKSSTLSAEKG